MSKGKRKQMTDAERIKRDEQRAAKFMELAPKRVTKALKAIDQVGKLAAKTYVRTPGQSKAIVEALFNAVNDVRKMYEGQGKKLVGFVLPS